MMFHTLDEFIQEWSYESESTQRILDLLTEESLETKVAEGERTLGFLAWHIVISIHEMMSRVGLEFDAPHHDAAVPNKVEEIKAGYRQANDNFIKAVSAMWTDANLKDEHDMYGEMWSNATTLNVLVKHQIHHRGQLSTLMRLAGLPMIGIYGPSREEWASYGADVPE